MNDLHNLFVNRHSIRRYTPEQLSPEAVKLIIEAGLLAPSSKSARPWQFIVVDDKDRLEALAKCKPAGAAPIAKCVMAIVVAADCVKSDVWIEDASIAAAYMQLQAETLGLGSCWIQIRNRFTNDDLPADEYVRDIVGLPEEYPVVCILTFGHKDETRRPVDTSKLMWEKVNIDTWKQRE